MISSSAQNLFVKPYMMWSQLAWKASEMAVSSMQVIGQRTGRFLLSGAAPGVRDQREFDLMGREKSEAAFEAAHAISTHALMLNQQFITLVFKQATSVSVALLSIAGSRTAAESVDRQVKLARDTATRSAVVASTLSGATARLTRSALKPVHKRVSRNARRLRKR